MNSLSYLGIGIKKINYKNSILISSLKKFIDMTCTDNGPVVLSILTSDKLTRVKNKYSI